MNTHELWHAVLGELELRLSKANFTTWFKRTFICVHDHQEVIIGVPNTFTKAWLEKKYHKDILQLLQQFTNIQVRSVSYRVEVHAGPSTIPFEVSQTQEEAGERLSETISSFPVPSATPASEDLFRKAAQTSHHPTELTLNPKYQFSTFVVGKQNELAGAASQAVAAQPGGVYNPLFIYGGVGLGKTHLLQAIGNEIRRTNPEAKILYVTSEQFTNEFIHSIRTGKAKEFKDLYRTVDLLLIDDIQFITGKEQTQEEFFHTFNALHQNNKQIVLTSDRPPRTIPGLEQRLRTRFEWGMMADIGIPDFEMRMAILETKCREKGYLLGSEILRLVATAIQSNVRELEGALNKVIAFHQFKNLTPSVESVKPMLVSFQPPSLKKTVTAQQLIQTVAVYYGITSDGLLGKSREQRLAFPRQIIMYLMRDELRSSYPSIGTELGGRDHTTAMHAYGKISTRLSTDEQLQHDLEMIRQRLYAIQ
ncbi:MAG TPA: chromosomal replication initiator protein DnaA [Patescibacteria group bacterium]|nr:chromosomal replication initiator protein DnaA [Patescibacteria group bacterium]